MKSASTTVVTSDVLKLDYDGPIRADLRELVQWSALQLGVKVVGLARKRSARGQGWHVRVQLNRALPVQAVVALQAILGSDPRREVFNLSRALVLGDAPQFWQSRWNVLYHSKLGDTRMLDMNKYAGEGRQLEKQKSLKPEHLGDAPYAIFTIENVREVMAKRGTKKDAKPEPQLVLEFVELPGFVYWTNFSGIRKLIHGLGQEERDWFGKRIVLEQRTTKNPSTGKPAKVLWIADSRTWAKHFEDHDGAKTRKPRARKSAKKGVKGAAKKR